MWVQVPPELKENSLIGKTLYCDCKIMGSSPISRQYNSVSLNGRAASF